MSEKIELTAAQKQAILDFWNQRKDSPPAVQEFVNLVWPNSDFDHRSPQYAAVKAFLASRRLKPKSRADSIEISEAHKEYIKNNSPAMNALDMARVIFNNPALTNLSAETRAINEYLKSIESEQIVNPDVSDVPMGNYEPPDTIHKALKKVNEYTSLGIKAEEIRPVVRKGLEALIKYLATYRFIKQINSLETLADRKSFEDAFIRYTYDKPELTQEEIDQYITLATEVVLAFKAQRRSERLQAMLEEVTSRDAESIKLSMSLVEMIGKAQTEYNFCIKRQQDLLEDLTEKRSEKLGKQISENASVLNLVQEWKVEEFRKKMMALAKIEDRQIEGEIAKMENITELKGRIMGLTKNEAKYG